MRTLVSYRFKYYQYGSNDLKDGEIKALNKLDLKNKILLDLGRAHLVKLEKYRIGKDDFVELQTKLPTKIYKKVKLLDKKDLLFEQNGL